MDYLKRKCSRYVEMQNKCDDKEMEAHSSLWSYAFGDTPRSCLLLKGLLGGFRSVLSGWLEVLGIVCVIEQ